MKDYQTEPLDGPIPVPESVNVAMADIAATMREGLLAMAVGAGLQVMQALMDESVTAICGPKGKHMPDRGAVRHGSEDGAVSLGGRRVSVRRPRVRTRGWDRGSAGWGLRAVQRYRAAGRDGHGPDAGQAVHPPLFRRVGASGPVG